MKFDFPGLPQIFQDQNQPFSREATHYRDDRHTRG